MNGERLKVAREAHWMTQAELSKASGVPASTISKIEQGMYRSDADRFASQLAVALDLPSSFLSDDPLPDVPAGRYRKQSKASAKLQKSVIAHAKQVAAVMAEADTRYKIRSTTLVPLDSGSPMLDNPVEIASELRELLGISQEGPVGNMTRACERAGIAVVNLPIFDLDEPLSDSSEKPEDTKHFSGFSMWPGLGGDHKGRPIILLSSVLPGDVQRATIAHELAHVYVHTRNRDVNDKTAEAQAWQIGDLVAVPLKEAREILSDGRVTLDRLKRMKLRYGVSVKLLITYCAHNGIINQEKSTSLYKQYTSRGWNKGEPFEQIRENAKFFPSVLRRMQEDGLDIGLNRLEVARIAAEGQKTPGSKGKGGRVLDWSAQRGKHSNE